MYMLDLFLLPKEITMATTKKDIKVKGVSAATLELQHRCGECLHFSGHQHIHKVELCTKLGVRAIALAPAVCFTPDVTQLVGNSDQFVQLTALLDSYSTKQKRILMGLLIKRPNRIGRYRDLPLGTKVFFHGMGKDYISNYLSGYVVGATSSGELIISGSPDANTRGKSYIAYMTSSDNIMTITEWKLKRAELKAQGKVLDPQSKIMPSAKSVGDQPVTIDSAPDTWHDKRTAASKKKNKNRDLTITIS